VKVWGGELDREAALVNAVRAFVDLMNDPAAQADSTRRAFEQLELALELYEDNND
jgi:hypothetical protein